MRNYVLQRRKHTKKQRVRKCLATINAQHSTKHLNKHIDNRIIR